MNAVRRFARLLPLIVLLLVVLPVHAQDESLGLSGDDAALWQSAYAATFSSGQYAYHYDLQFDYDIAQTAGVGARLKGQGQLDLSGSAPGAAFDAAGDIRFGSSYTFPVDLQSRLIDGQLYLNTAGGWQTMPFSAPRVTFSGGPIVAPSGAANAAELALGAADDPFVGGFYTLIPDLFALKPATFAAMQRLPNADGLADFQLTVDSPKLVAGAELIALMRNFSQNEGIFQTTFDDARWKAVSQQLADFFARSSLTVDFFLDPTAKVIRRVVVDGTAQADPAAMKMTGGPVTAKLHLDVMLDSAGQPQTIAVPDGAQTVDSFAFPLGDSVPAFDPAANEQLLMLVGVLKDGGSYSLPLDLKAGQTVTLVARGIGLDFDTIVTLLSPGGDELASNDYLDTPDYMVGPNAGEIRDFKIPTDGTYQVKAEQYEQSPGAFLLSVYVKN